MEREKVTSPILRLSNNISKERVIIGGIELKTQIIGGYFSPDLAFRGFVTTDLLFPLFMNYNEGELTIECFFDRDPWAPCRPIYHFRAFEYDPATGEKLNWDKIRKAVKNEIAEAKKEAGEDYSYYLRKKYHTRSIQF